ncbi:hypothetical protein M0R45_035774 [Rubus argutus]|uniref:Uncharacterized protein n=1 Tax=Rubus argutus TaxID=59490 RepID=A0AAW1VWQ9_RUBAR
MAENTEIVSKEEPKGSINLFSLFSKLKLQFPFWKQQEPQQGWWLLKMKLVRPVGSGTFSLQSPSGLRSWRGFWFVKWIWARWQERRDQNEDEKDDEKVESSDDEKSSVDE